MGKREFPAINRYVRRLLHSCDEQYNSWLRENDVDQRPQPEPKL